MREEDLSRVLLVQACEQSDPEGLYVAFGDRRAASVEASLSLRSGEGSSELDSVALELGVSMSSLNTLWILAAIQFGPKLVVIGTRSDLGLDEHAVVMTLDLVQGVAHGIQEVFVRSDDRSIHFEFDHCLGFIDGS